MKNNRIKEEIIRTNQENAKWKERIKTWPITTRQRQIINKADIKARNSNHVLNKNFKIRGSQLYKTLKLFMNSPIKQTSKHSKITSPVITEKKSAKIKSNYKAPLKQLLAG